MMGREYWPGCYLVMDNPLLPMALLLVGSHGSRGGLSNLESGGWIDGK